MQLKMYWYPGTPIFDGELPEGYSIKTYSGEADIEAWLACCRNGLVGDDSGREAFDSSILSISDIIPERDVFFLEYKGELVGTTTGFIIKDQNIGDLHMVGVRSDFRGKGLSKYLVAAALRHMASFSVRFVKLTTDEWRENAVRSYLNAGFKPVQYGLGMEDRWQAMLETLNIDSFEMVYDDGEAYKTVYRTGLSKKIRFGVFGAGRGQSMMNYAKDSGSCELVAICDKSDRLLDMCRESFPDVKRFKDFDEFIKEDLDFIVLANFANEHAPFAVKAMRAGISVLSEVLPVQNLAEAVELIETVEETGCTYGYAENTCYMPGPRKMRELYGKGKLGSFEYGEGEYMHNCEDGWHKITGGDPCHWRNTMSAFFYGTHSFGPIIHTTGLKPVQVMAFEGPYNSRMRRMGALGGPFGAVMVTLENGALAKSVYGVGPARNSIWFSFYGSKGRMETAREDAENGGTGKLYLNLDEHEGDNCKTVVEADVDDDLSEKASAAGHDGSDYYLMYNFIEKMRGNKYADVIDVYEAMDMFLPSLFGYRSVLEGKPLAIPDLRDKKERDRWRTDTACTDPKAAGDMLQPSYSKGNPVIPQETYDFIKNYPRDKDMTGEARRELGCPVEED